MANKFKGKVGTLYLRDVPRALRDCFHAACARRGKPMRRIILDYMREFVKDDQKLKIPRKHIVTGLPKRGQS